MSGAVVSSLAGARALFGVITELKSHGAALIHITHKFDELARVCDDVTVMRDGRVVAEAAFDELTRAMRLCG